LGNVQYNIRNPALLAKGNSKSAPPSFRKADTNEFKLRRKRAQNRVDCRMKSRCRSNEVDDGRRGLQFDYGEIAGAGDIALIKMALDAQPIVRGLKRQV